MNYPRTRLFLTAVSDAFRQHQHPALLIAGMVLMASQATAQRSVPASIKLRPALPRDKVTVTWPTVPGKTYDVFTTEDLGQPWVATNISPVRARSTISVLTNDTSAPMKFYRIKEKLTPPGNTGVITAASVTELEKTLGVTFTAAQRSQLVPFLQNNRGLYETMRKIPLHNSDPLPLIFNPIPPGFSMESTQRLISWSVPKNATMPANRADLAFYSVRDLGELIRTRQITSTELTSFYLERLKRYDPKLHCVITLTEELALRQAARADEELAAGTYRGPLHGLPYGIKDLFSVRGYPTTWGAAPFKDQVIEEDATVVQRLEQAGAVLVAKLSTGELAANDVWFGGQTRNPWNINEGSGGSSAGPASATSAGLVAFAIGTETWGSIIEPCTRCRVTGLRSTFGRISRSGAMTLSWSMDKIGPICRNVEDCAIVFEAIRGADGIDQAVINAPFNYAPNLDLTKLRVGYRSSFVNPAILGRLRAIVGDSQLVSINLPANTVDPVFIIDAEAASAFDELFRYGADAFLSQNIWREELLKGRTIPAVEYLQANRLRQKLIQDMAAVLKDLDLYVTLDNDPSGGTLDVTNLTGQPCVVIPHGSGVSLSFIGRPFGEATILQLAKAYQDATTFHTNRPPGFVQ
jgi:Asp-tRNA(Asn)/Glu-tRNA(Gln) amidotransferase A subunit family amidase